MKQFIKQQIQQINYSEPMMEALKLILNDQIHPYLLAEKLEPFRLNASDLKPESMPLLIGFICRCLEDNIITEEELRDANKLKVFFKIQEGELLKLYKDQIEYLISCQLELIYADNIVDDRESMAKVSLQNLFDLSYDQYLQFERKAVKLALDRGAELHNLDTFYQE